LWLVPLLAIGCGWAISARATAPREPVDQRHTSQRVHEMTCDDGRSLSQTFRPEYPLTERIELSVQARDAIPRTDPRTWLEVTRQLPNGRQVVVDVAEGWVEERTRGHDRLVFEFPAGLALVPSEDYALRWTPPEDDSVRWLIDEDGGYEDGLALDCGGAPRPGADFLFASYASARVSADPDPCPDSCSAGILSKSLWDDGTGRCATFEVPCAHGCSADEDRCADSDETVWFLTSGDWGDADLPIPCPDPDQPCFDPLWSGPPDSMDWSVPDPCAGDPDGDGVDQCDDLCPGTPQAWVSQVDATGCHGCKADEDGGDRFVAGGVYAADSLASKVVPGKDGKPLTSLGVALNFVAEDACLDGMTLLEYSCDFAAGTPCLDSLPYEINGISSLDDWACVVDPSPNEPAGTVTVDVIDCACGCAYGACIDGPDTDGDGLMNCIDDDDDDDGLADEIDNCPFDPNPGQADTDGDGEGDPCDVCPNNPDPDDDEDEDGVCDDWDNCVGIANWNQADADGDGFGDSCDLCPGGDDGIDSDGDFYPDACDNCPDWWNVFQTDIDGDGEGDSCDCDDGFSSAPEGWFPSLFPATMEEGVDCGGSCSASCDYRELEVHVVYEDQTAQGTAGGGVGPLHIHDKDAAFFSMKMVPDGNFKELQATKTDTDGRATFIVPNELAVGDIDVRIRPWNSRAQAWVDVVNEWDEWCETELLVKSSGLAWPASGDASVTMRIDDPGTNTDPRTRERPDWCTPFGCGCGESSVATTLGNGGAGYFSIADTVRMAWDYADTLRDDNDHVPRLYLQAPGGGSFHSGQYEIINVGDDLYADGEVAHEYGHFLQDQISTPDAILAGEDSGHQMCDPWGGATVSDETEFAYQEGWADYWAANLLSQYRSTTPGLVTQHWLDQDSRFTQSFADNPGCAGLDIEATSMAILWDIIDETGDPLFPAVVVPEAGDPSPLLPGVDWPATVFAVFDNELDDWWDIDAPDICEHVAEIQNRMENSGHDPALLDAIVTLNGVSCN